MRSGVPCFCASFPCQTLIRRVPAKCVPQPHAHAPHATPNRSHILDSGETRRARPLSTNTSTQSPWLKSAAMMVVVCMQYIDLSISTHKVIVERTQGRNRGSNVRASTTAQHQRQLSINCQSCVFLSQNACVRMSHTRRAPAVPAYLRALEKCRAYDNILCAVSSCCWRRHDKCCHHHLGSHSMSTPALEARHLTKSTQIPLTSVVQLRWASVLAPPEE